MIFDDIADVMVTQSMREIRRKTGLSNDKIKRMRDGCPFHLDYVTLYALQRLGYDLHLEKSVRRSEHLGSYNDD